MGSCFHDQGPSLMDEWSKELPLTASCLSPLPGFESRPGHVRRLPRTRGKMMMSAITFLF